MSLEQARVVAEAARQRRAALLAALASGDVSPADLERDRRADEVKAVAIAEAAPGIGKVRARRAVEQVGAPLSARWADLTPAQRQHLVEELTSDGARPTTAP